MYMTCSGKPLHARFSFLCGDTLFECAPSRHMSNKPLLYVEIYNLVL